MAAEGALAAEIERAAVPERGMAPPPRALAAQGKKPPVCLAEYLPGPG